MAKQTQVSPSEIDQMIRKAVFGDEASRERERRRIQQLAQESGITLASIDSLYEAAGHGLYHSVTVPAMNIRGITYDACRAAFRAALKMKVGAFIFEIARSEIGYTDQRPAEYSTCVLAAALREGFKGKVFIQGDHFQVSRSKFATQPEKELESVRQLIREAVEAGFYNIDIDASTLVDISKEDLNEQQKDNCRITAEMTKFIRSIQPAGVSISVGGEIGEVGKQNSTAGDLQAFMNGYLGQLEPGMRGISKISVQTGTTHGGVVLPDGSIAHVNLDFATLGLLSKLAREKYGMGGAVQHGASTLPDDAFDLFPKAGAVEVHLATGFQNIIFESPHFPTDLLQEINRGLGEKYAAERSPQDTEDQFLYKTRKKAFGDFKKQLWDLPEETRRAICDELEARFGLLYEKLNVVNTVSLTNRFVK